MTRTPPKYRDRRPWEVGGRMKRTVNREDRTNMSWIERVVRQVRYWSLVHFHRVFKLSASHYDLCVHIHVQILTHTYTNVLHGTYPLCHSCISRMSVLECMSVRMHVFLCVRPCGRVYVCVCPQTVWYVICVYVCAYVCVCVREREYTMKCTFHGVFSKRLSGCILYIAMWYKKLVLHYGQKLTRTLFWVPIKIQATTFVTVNKYSHMHTQICCILRVSVCDPHLYACFRFSPEYVIYRSFISISSVFNNFKRPT